MGGGRGFGIKDKWKMQNRRLLTDAQTAKTVFRAIGPRVRGDDS